MASTTHDHHSARSSLADQHDHDDHGLAHTASVKVLVGTGSALLMLTFVTVAATRVDFGANINLAIAMFIAVVKATLVILFFMHLKYDKVFHTVVFVSAILAAALFVGFTLMDSNQYQETNIWNPDAPPVAPYGPRPTPG
jgi:cytochrome c oxidase subunit 4